MNDNQHDHCQACFRIKCRSRDALASCPLVPCVLSCGAIFHACKELEHKDVCRYERVACINAVYGCPKQLARWETGRHLETCPASVVYCTMEWNRWPVFSKERQDRVPFIQKNLHARYGQLDVALAIRDQRMLDEAMKAPSSVRRSLRNRLTERFPAVPLNMKRSLFVEDSATIESSTITSDEDTYSDAPWERSKDPPGLQRSICKELFGTSVSEEEGLTSSEVVDSFLEEVVSKISDVENELNFCEIKLGEFENISQTSVNYQVQNESKNFDIENESKTIENELENELEGIKAENALKNLEIENHSETLNIDHESKFIETQHECNTFEIKNGPKNIENEFISFEVENESETCEVQNNSKNSEVNGEESVISNIDDIIKDELQSKNDESVVKDAFLNEFSIKTKESRSESRLSFELLEENKTSELFPNTNICSNVNERDVYNDSEQPVLNDDNSSKLFDVDAENISSKSDKCLKEFENTFEEKTKINEFRVMSTTSSEKTLTFIPDVEMHISERRDILGELPSGCRSDLSAESLGILTDATKEYRIRSKTEDGNLFLPEIIDSNILNDNCNVEIVENKVFPSPPDCPPLLQHVLALDLNLESITRYQAKPRSMYTFLCAQPFRRDEFLWHFKNTHSEIHGGLSGWIENRCPLACYGCTYSFRRLNPVTGNLLYSSVVDSFGVRPNEVWNFISDEATKPADVEYFSGPPPPGWKEATPEIFTSKDYDSPVDIKARSCCQSEDPTSLVVIDNIGSVDNVGNFDKIDNDHVITKRESRVFFESLPFEILQHIARCLDSFSLCNLALTSLLFREVCRSLVEDRGIVIQEWEKRKIDDVRSTWTIAYQRWLFSNAFTPIETWKFESAPSLSEHLKVCPFNILHDSEKRPFRLCSMTPIVPREVDVNATLRKMYPRFDVEESEDLTDDIFRDCDQQRQRLYVDPIGTSGFTTYQRYLKKFADSRLQVGPCSVKVGDNLGENIVNSVDYSGSMPSSD